MHLWWKDGIVTLKMESKTDEIIWVKTQKITLKIIIVIVASASDMAFSLLEKLHNVAEDIIIDYSPGISSMYFILQNAEWNTYWQSSNDMD